MLIGVHESTMCIQICISNCNLSDIAFQIYVKCTFRFYHPWELKKNEFELFKSYSTQNSSV